MSANNFKVIVVGGGPVGLTAAIALEKAGIDLILLERRPEVVINAGSNLVLLPEGLRALTQLGLLDAINAVSTPLGRINRVDHDGRIMKDMHWFVLMKELLDIAPRVISRHDLCQVLYNSLSRQTQAKLLPNKKLADVQSVGDGVVASCTDGSTYAGSFVIGADGAHSRVRNLLWSLSRNTTSDKDSVQNPFWTTYRALWARFPTPPQTPPGTTCETHGHLTATQLFAGEESAVIGVYERLEKPTRERLRYTQADQDSLVARWGHIPVTADKSLTLRDVYESRSESGLVSLEEGVVEQWSWDGKIVLVGDAAHKFTPSTGGGCNNGIIDIIALVNQVNTAVKKAQTTSETSAAVPSRQDLVSAFEAYQTQRFEAVVAGCKGASHATAAATWQTSIHKLMDRRILSSERVQRLLFSQGAKGANHTPTMQFGQKQAVPQPRAIIGTA